MELNNGVDEASIGLLQSAVGDDDDGTGGESGLRRRHASYATRKGSEPNNSEITDQTSEEETVGDETNKEDVGIPPDTFSILFLAEGCVEHILPLSVFGVQMLILILIFINLFQQGRPSNRWNIPVNVPPTVRISQFIACLVSVFSADDFVTGIMHTGNSFTHTFSLPGRGGGHEISIRWEISNLMRLAEGTLTLVAMFGLIIQSTQAIDLWLNFAGVAFVGLLDDTTFILAKNGFFGRHARILSNRVCNIEFHRSSTGTKKRILKVVAFAGTALIMLIGLAVIAVQQQDQKMFACSAITLTVGDPKYVWARYLGGTYTLEDNGWSERAVYVQVQSRGSTKLAYCREKERWTVTHKKDCQQTVCPCKEIQLMSRRTKSHESFDINEVTDLYFWDGDKADIDVKCNDCHRDTDCSENGSCNLKDRICECKKDETTGKEKFFGSYCQFHGPCTEVEMHKEFPGDDYAFEKSFDLLLQGGKPVMVYDRPVYFQQFTPGIIDQDKDQFGLIIFDGGRWEVVRSKDLWDWYNTSKEQTLEDLTEYLQNELISGNRYDANYISEPSKLGSPTEVPFRAWMSVAHKSIGKLGEEEYELLCADCVKGNSGISPCVDYDGHENETMCEQRDHKLFSHRVNRCACDPGFMGPLCQVRPVEGTLSLYLDYGNEQKCLTCGNGNVWPVWNLNGIYWNWMNFPNPEGALEFEGVGRRGFGLYLDDTWFDVYVTHPDIGDWKEVFSIKRNVSNERIGLDFAVSLDETNGFNGTIVDPEDIECQATTEAKFDHFMCNLDRQKKVNATLKRAWLLLNLKVTPIN